MEDTPKDDRRVLTREEFDEDQKIQRECLDSLKKYDDFEKNKKLFAFDIMTYEEYMVKYQKLYKMPDNGEEVEKNIVVDSIEE